MFTGIVQGTAPVVAINRKPGLLTVGIRLPHDALAGAIRGASIAVDGVCLTVAGIEGEIVTFDIMAESLERTTLGALGIGHKVNFERSLKFGDEIGGHLLSGHVDGVATLSKIEHPENNCVLTLSVPPNWMKYLFPKGYIGLNGASLTIAAIDKAASSFTVFLIPETLRLTTFSAKKAGEKINFEIERQTQAIVDTVENFLAAKN